MPRGPGAIWTIEKICKSKEEIDLWLVENSSWSYHKREREIQTSTDVYFCQYSKQNREKRFNCKARMRIRYMNDISEAYIQTSGAHDHRRLIDNGLSSPVKRKIEDLDEPHSGKTAKHIQRTIQEDVELEGLVIPSLKQVQNQKADKARKRQFTRSLTLNQVKDYFEVNRKVPVDENQPYAVGFEHRVITLRDEDGVQKPSVQFYLVITTNKLQRRQATWPSIQVDGTYKLMTLCYPLLVAGFSDANKVFHPTYVAISSHEDTWSYSGFLSSISFADPQCIYKPKLLLADGATQITAACRKVFPGAKRGMCLAHVIMDFNKDLPKAKIHERAVEEIKEDVNFLARANSLLELAAASRTLWIHWTSKWGEIPRLAQACTKFFNSWLLREDYRGWYYRYAPAFAMFSISTNNGLEGTNKMIKDDFTHRELLGLSRFILVVEQLTHGWSIDPERKKPVKVPTIPENPNSNLRKAVEKLREEKRPFLPSVYLQEYVWLIRSSSCNTDAELELMWTELLQAETTDDLDWTYSSWRRYQILRNSFYVLKKSRVYPGFLCCSSPVGIKDELCKHALLLMETEKLIDPLPRPLEPRRKRGRRKKVGRAIKRF